MIAAAIRRGAENCDLLFEQRARIDLFVERELLLPSSASTAEKPNGP